MEGNLKAKLTPYVDKKVNLEIYDIRINMDNRESGKVRIAIANSVTGQSYTFILSHDTENDSPQEYQQNDIYKKIAHAISMLEDDNRYNHRNYISLHEGDTFELGRYEGKPIEWRVLKKGEHSMYVLSEKILCSHRWDAFSSNWSNSEIRAWLNQEFYQAAFYEDEKNFIGSIDGDKITLLSKKEAERFMSKSTRSASSWWWLRSPYPVNSIYACRVGCDGSLYYAFFYVAAEGGVRPALQLAF